MAAPWSYNPQSYQDELKKSKASIPQAAQPKPPGAIPGMGYGQVMAASQAQAPAKPAIPQAPPTVAGNPAISQGMAAAYAAPKPQGAIPQAAPTPGSHASHQAYINKSTPGGMSAYQATQQGRYDQAYASGNQDEINKLNGDVQRVGYSLMIPQAAQPQAAEPVQQVAGPEPQYAIPQANYNDIASAEQARFLAERQRIADQQKGGLTRSFERGNAIQRDNRVLEDGRFSRSVNPFSGKTSYDKAMIGRERSLADESTLGNFNAGISGIEQGLADDKNTAAQAIMARAYQLEQDAKDFGLREGALTGNYGNGRTLQGQQFDWSQNVDEANLTGTYGGQKTAAQANTEWGQRFDYGQATGQFGGGQQTLENKKFQYTQGRDKVADGQWQKEFTRRAEQDGIQNAISWANNSLAADDNARQWVETDARLTGSEAPKYDGMSASQVVSTLQSQLFDSYGDLKPNVNKEQIYRSIVEYGLPDGQDDQAMLSLGLSRADINSFDKQFGVSSGN